jgi:hypothetical protein
VPTVQTLRTPWVGSILIPHRGTRSAQSAMDRRPLPVLIAGLTFFPKPLSWLRETPVSHASHPPPTASKDSMRREAQVCRSSRLLPRNSAISRPSGAVMTATS